MSRPTPRRSFDTGTCIEFPGLGVDRIHPYHIGAKITDENKRPRRIKEGLMGMRRILLSLWTVV